MYHHQKTLTPTIRKRCGGLIETCCFNSGSGSVTIKGNEHNSVIDLIDGAGSKILYYQYESLTCVAVDDGTASNVQNWYII